MVMVCVKVMLALAVCLGFLVGEGAVADCCLGVSTPLGEVCERSYSDTWWVTYKCVDSGGWSQQFELCAECCTPPPLATPPFIKLTNVGTAPTISTNGIIVCVCVPVGLLVLCVVGCCLACRSRRRTVVVYHTVGSTPTHPQYMEFHA
jgi:hypothetical protein